MVDFFGLVGACWWSLMAVENLRYLSSMYSGQPQCKVSFLVGCLRQVSEDYRSFRLLILVVQSLVHTIGLK